MSRIRSSPVTSGIWLSTSSTSKLRSPRIWRAALALSMATTSWPSSASALARSWRIFASSSTMSTEPGNAAESCALWTKRVAPAAPTRGGEGGAGRAGSVRRMVVPAPGWLSTSMRPPRPSTMFLRDGQADAGAAPLGREERLEHARHLDVGHADAAIGDAISTWSASVSRARTWTAGAPASAPRRRRRSPAPPSDSAPARRRGRWSPG